MVAAAIFGTLLQSGVIVFAVWIAYVGKFARSERGGHVETKESEKNSSAAYWGFPIFALGTAILISGMFWCAWLIERSTSEEYFKAGPGKKLRIYWLQPCNQSVGDKIFDAFAHSAELDEYITSWKDVKSKRSYKWQVSLAVGLTMAGFILQFIGLRALHFFVALSQLGATLIMSAIRAGLRTRRMGSNKNELQDEILNAVEGHELDWQALQVERDKGSHDESPDSWEVVCRPKPAVFNDGKPLQTGNMIEYGDLYCLTASTTQLLSNKARSGKFSQQ